MKPTFDRRQAATGESGATIDIRRPTTGWRHSTTDSRMSNVGRRLVVGRRMSNVVLWKDPATPQETAATTQERADTSQGKTGTTQESAVKDAVTTQEVAPKTGEVAPKGDEVAPKNAVKNAVKEFDAGLRETIIEKCAELYCFLRVDPRRTILTAVESLGFSPRSVAQYLNVLKDAHVLEHVGPTHGGAWKFLI